MNLEKYISELLYRHQCVAVPGFGAFLTETISAELIVGSNSFYPPKKLISFNSNLKNNDGLLANQLAFSEKIGYDQAVYAIDKTVIDWKLALENNNFLELKNIGNLSMNYDKNIVFNPTDNFNYLKTSFGLSAFVSPDVKRETAKQPVFVIEKPEDEEVLKETKIINIDKSSSFSNLKYAAVFLIGCGIASPVFLNLYKEKQAINNMLVQANVQKQVKSKIQEATFVINNPLMNVGANNSKNYHVVAGAFKVEANADKICRQLISKGFKAQKIKQNANGLFPVIYDSYANYGDARNAMLHIQQKNNNPDAWVMIQELDK